MLEITANWNLQLPAISFSHFPWMAHKISPESCIISSTTNTCLQTNTGRIPGHAYVQSCVSISQSDRNNDEATFNTPSSELIYLIRQS
jgi:hypothetical protein